MVKFPKISLVLGGVSSGKSIFAERLVQNTGLPKTYIATAQGHDAQMRAKIDRHQQMRGADWQTIETPLELAAALTDIPADQIVLIDCLTLWLSNQMLAQNDLDAAFDQLAAALNGSAAPVVLVSNEVGLGGIAENPLARQFQVYQGQLNQRIAAIAELVVFVTAGLPSALKGQLPEATQ